MTGDVFDARLNRRGERVLCGRPGCGGVIAAVVRDGKVRIEALPGWHAYRDGLLRASQYAARRIQQGKRPKDPHGHGRGFLYDPVPPSERSARAVVGPGGTVDRLVRSGPLTVTLSKPSLVVCSRRKVRNRNRNAGQREYELCGAVSRLDPEVLLRINRHA